MSIRLMSGAWGIDGVEITQRLLLMALADHANDAGVCWPGLPHLALKMHLSLRQVRRLLRQLERQGFFTVESPRCGRGHHKRFILNLDKFLGERGTSVSSFQRGKSVKGDIQGLKGDIAMSVKGDMVEHKTTTTVMNHQEDNHKDFASRSKRRFDDILAGSPPPGLS